MSVLEAHPHAAAVLGAALRTRPSHAYLFHGPAGSGKREAARAFAAELLARDAPDPDNAKARALAGVHPDLTWVAPSGAHIMLRGEVGRAKPWGEALDAARTAGRAAEAELEEALAEELQYLPKKEHRRKQTEFTERARRAARRAETAALDHALQLAGLWYRDLACLAADADELVLATDRLEELRTDIATYPCQGLQEALELVEDTRMRLPFNVSSDLALQALAYRLERLLASATVTA